jgi:signal transduction histidine kinase
VKNNLLFGCLLIFFSFQGKAQLKIDSLLHLCEKASGKEKIDLLLQLSSNTRSDSAKSNFYCKQAYQLALKNKQIPQQALSFFYLAETRYDHREFTQAIPYYQKAIPYYESLKDTLNLTNCYNNIGLCYYYNNQGEKAIEHFIEALRLSKNDLKYQSKIYSNIAMVHTNLNNARKAISNFKIAVKINTSINDEKNLAIDYNGLGNVYLNINQPDSALDSYAKAKTLFRKLKKRDLEAIVLTNIALIYPNYPDSLNKSIDYFNSALQIFKELGFDYYEADVREGIGVALLKQKKYNEALRSLKLSLALSDQYKRGGFLLKKNIYKDIATLYKETGNYNKALEAQILFTQYSDSMQLSEKTSQIANLEKQYETEKKEAQIKQLQAKQELLSIQLQKNRQLKLFGFVSVFLLLLAVLFVSMRYVDKVKSNKLLAQKNKTIEENAQELRKINASKNKFFSIIAHDLKNPFHTLMGYSYLLSESYDQFNDQKRRKFATDINQSATNIFRLLQNLLEWSHTQTGRLVVAPREIELNHIIRNSSGVLLSQAELKNITLKIDCNDNLFIYADPQMIETVLRNLVSNAIKFTPANGNIELTACKTGDFVEVCINDTGIGISEEDIENLFKIDSKVKRKGTNNEDGSGLGLILCKEFITRNNGNIWVKSSLGKGSSFFFSIPVPKEAS